VLTGVAVFCRFSKLSQLQGHKRSQRRGRLTGVDLEEGSSVTSSSARPQSGDPHHTDCIIRTVLQHVLQQCLIRAALASLQGLHWLAPRHSCYHSNKLLTI
jgi:hypothetical protein